ncbi:MAG: ABC transporter substrate-binding protein [Negativibacillus sp.]
MRKNKLTRFLALALAATMLLSACGGSETETKAPENTAPSTQNTASAPSAESNTTEVTYKTEVNVAITANPPSLDVQATNSNIVGGIGSHIYEPLFAMNANYEPTAVLAESYDVSEDGKVYTIKLRQGVKFHNGQEMKADDVVASMTRWLDKSGKAKALLNGSVFEKVDDYTVTLTVPEAYADVMTVLAASIQFPTIMPASTIDADNNVTEYIGTGPYKLAEWKQDQYIHLTKYEEYQQPNGESSGFTGRKEAYAQDLYYRVVTDDATRIAGVQTGQYDIAEEMPQERYAELAADSNLVLSSKTAGTLNLFFNTTNGIMANQDMRQAIMACLNTNDIMMGAYGDADLYVLNPGWCNPSDSQWGSEAGSEYYNQNNIEKAKELLQKAGYNNEEIVLVTTPDYNEMYNATLVVQAQLLSAGINAVVESYDFATFMEHRSNPDQFSLYITSNRYNLSPVQLSVLTKDWAGLDVAEVDEAIVKIRTAASAADSRAEWEKLQEFLYEYGAASVLGHYSGIIASGADVEGFNYFDFPLYWNVRVPE